MGGVGCVCVRIEPMSQTYTHTASDNSVSSFPRYTQTDRTAVFGWQKKKLAIELQEQRAASILLLPSTSG